MGSCSAVLALMATLFGWGGVPAAILQNLYIGYAPSFVGAVRWWGLGFRNRCYDRMVLQPVSLDPPDTFFRTGTSRTCTGMSPAIQSIDHMGKERPENWFLHD